VLEWDEAKRLTNLSRRGLDFADADLVFDGRPVTTAPSRHNNEERFVSTAEINGRLTVVWTCWARINGLFRSEEQAMAKKERIVRYSAEELAAMRRRGKTRSDWMRAAAMTDEEIERDIASDPDEAGMVVSWDKVSVELPQRKADLHMRIDRDVLDFFRKGGRGYQSRINTILRSYVEQARQK
jgi:uncharacterized protein (DUF4415 family)